MDVCDAFSPILFRAPAVGDLGQERSKLQRPGVERIISAFPSVYNGEKRKFAPFERM
jgi:hypothetical protein